MTLNNTALNIENNVSLNFNYASLTYNTQVNLFPFTKNESELRNKELEIINTPVAHFKFKVLHIEQSIFKSFFLMSGQLLWLEENTELKSIEEIIQFILKEEDFFNRMDIYLKKKKKENQLSLF